jgi:hypothetical protein
MTGRRSARRAARVLVAAGLVMVAGSIAGIASASADQPPALGFFDVTASSAGIGASFGDPNSQPYPVAAGLVPNSVASLSTGPSGQAQSSVLWPGPLLGNAGSLANVIGTPLPPEVVSSANDPVVARASAGGGGSDEQTLGPMAAKVEGSDSRAATALDDVDAPGVVTAAKVVATAHSYLEGATAVSIGASTLQGVDVAGVLHISNIHTVAKGTTDGTTAATKQEVIVSGATLNGQAVTIDRDGIHAGSGTVPLGSALTGAKPALDPMGIRAFVTEPLAQTSSGGAASIESGSLVVEWSPPGSTYSFTVVLGGSSANVRATPATDAASAVGDVFTPGSDAVLPAPAPLGGDVAPVAASPEPATAPAPHTGPATGAPLQRGTDLQLAAAVTDRPPIGWVVIGVLGAALLGIGLHSLRNQALVAALAGTSCPLERS